MARLTQLLDTLHIGSDVLSLSFHIIESYPSVSFSFITSLSPNIVLLYYLPCARLAAMLHLMVLFVGLLSTRIFT